MTDESKYCIGVDISKYEVQIRDYSGTPESVINYWSPDKSKKKIDFVIQRTSYGGKQDEFLELLYKECLKIPIRGAYHYFSTGVGWQHQLETIKKAIKGKDYHFFVVDYEEYYNNLNHTSFAEMMELVKQLQLFTKKKVMIYFNPNVYNTAMKPYNADVVINNYPIWIAQYPWKLFLNLDKGPSLPKGVNRYDIWQYGGADIPTAAGYLDGFDYGSYRKGIDLNIFNGTKEEMMIWAGVNDTETPPPPPTEKSRYSGSVLPSVTLGLQVRVVPVNGKKVGLLGAQQTFEADKLTTEFDNKKWFHIVKPIEGYIAEAYTKWVNNDEVEIPPVNSKPAIPGPFRIQSYRDVGEPWNWPEGKLDSYPAVCHTKGGKGNISLSGDGKENILKRPTKGFMKSISDIMNSLQWKQTWIQNQGWHNKGDLGTVQQVEFAHNLKWITGINSDGFYEYDIYYNTDSPPNLNSEFDKYRQGIMTVDYKTGHEDTGGVIESDNRLPYISIANDRTEKLRIDPKYLKSLLNLPIDCKVKTVGGDLNIRETPINGKIVGKYKNNDTITVLEVIKPNHQVWLKTDKGYIASWLTDLDI